MKSSFIVLLLFATFFLCARQQSCRIFRSFQAEEGLRHGTELGKPIERGMSQTRVRNVSGQCDRYSRFRRSSRGAVIRSVSLSADFHTSQRSEQMLGDAVGL